MTDGPQIQIDDDWKAQAQAEREKLAERERLKKAEQEAQTQRDAMKKDVAGASGAPSATSDAPPGSSESTDAEPADFGQLVTTLASQALMYLGLVPDPQTGQRMVGFEYARRQIDLLEVLGEKTQGNLTEEESNSLASMLHQLRDQYVQTVIAMRPIPTER